MSAIHDHDMDKIQTHPCARELLDQDGDWRQSLEWPRPRVRERKSKAGETATILPVLTESIGGWVR